MKALSMVRKVDELGRVVLPIEVRRMFDINERDSLEIFVDDNRIVLRKYEPACMFCHNVEDVIVYGDRNICKECATKIKDMACKKGN